MMNLTKLRPSTASDTDTKKTSRWFRAGSHRGEIDQILDLYWGGPERRITGLTLKIIGLNVVALVSLLIGVFSLGQYQNILIQSKDNGSGFDIRLSDFGLAKFANSSSSLTGDVNFLGTIAYCAPEQIMREELDHRADIYSLGLVVFELLTGRHAFHDFRKDAQALISKQLTSVPTSVREHNKNIAVELERAM